MARQHRGKRLEEPPPRLYAARTYAGTTVVLFVVLASVVTLCRRDTEQDFVSPNEVRFQTLRAALPARGTIGYVSDPAIGDIAQLRARYLAQYSLAPILISANPDQDIVLGNFSGSAGIAAVLGKGQFILVHNFGNGVLLMKKSSSENESVLPPDTGQPCEVHRRPVCCVDQMGDVQNPPSNKLIEVSSRRTFTVSGWAADSARKTAAASVDVVLDSKPYMALYGLERIDVATYYNNSDYRNTGFLFMIPASRLTKGHHTIALRVISIDNKSCFQGDNFSLVVD